MLKAGLYHGQIVPSLGLNALPDPDPFINYMNKQHFSIYDYYREKKKIYNN